MLGGLVKTITMNFHQNLQADPRVSVNLKKPFFFVELAFFNVIILDAVSFDE